MYHQTDLIEHVQKVLPSIGKLAVNQIDGLRPAAVLLLLVKIDKQWNLLFIHRAEIGEMHRGEVAFPGGAKEGYDRDLVETALRESQEEIGINPERVKVLGFLPSLNTVSRYLVTPIVGTVTWPFEIQQNWQEVERVFTIPLEWLANVDHWQEVERDLSNRGKVRVIDYQEYDGEHLWGVTARITKFFLELIK